MTFQKGNKLGKGRPKGSKNYRTQYWDNIGDFLVNEGAEKYLQALQTLNDKEYRDEFVKILEYFKPKRARTEVKADVKASLELTNEQKERLAKRS